MKVRELLNLIEGSKKRSERDIIKDINNIENLLSPENLFADGERSKKDALILKKKLLKKYKVLIKELGREPTDQELYGK